MHHEDLGRECLRRWHGGSRVPVSLGEGDAGTQEEMGAGVVVTAI